MGKHSNLRLFATFAGSALLLVAAVGSAFSFLWLQNIRHQAEDEVAGATRRTVGPVVERAASGDASLEEAAASVLSDQVLAARVWDASGEVLASAGETAGGAPARNTIARAGGGENVAYRASAGDGDVLVTLTALSAGRVLEVREDYGPVQSSIAESTRDFLVLVAASGVALVLGLPAVLWVAVRGLDREYNRLVYLHRSGQAIRSTLEVTSVLEKLARDAAVFSSGRLAMGALVEEGTDDLIVQASYDAGGKSTAQHHRKMEEWYMRRCAGMGETVQAQADVQPYASVLGYEPDTHGLATVLCVAIPGRQASIGVLLVARDPADGEFTTIEVQTIEEMAAQAAMTVEQAMLFAKVRSYAEEVELNYDSTLKVLMAALDAKDTGSQGHSERVSRLTVELAKELGVHPDRLLDIERGALLHDVGEIGVPDEVLRKPAALDSDEWESMRKHPLLAGLMVSKVGFLEGALPILLYHHERYDGSGYPFGLDGKAIPLEARIFGVVDAYDAMTSDRPYRKAMPHALAVREIASQAGAHFDPEIVKAFLRVIERLQPTLEQAS